MVFRGKGTHKRATMEISVLHAGNTLLLTVFESLSVVDILRAGTVSSAWHSAAHMPSLWELNLSRREFLVDAEDLLEVAETRYRRLWATFGLLYPRLMLAQVAC